MKKMRKARTYLPDTIAAIATPPGSGGLGVIRISGRGSPAILAQIFNNADGINVAKMATHKLYYGAVTTGAATGEKVLAVIMREPHSYTKEETVEIYCHGGSLILKSILAEINKAGARLAEPGEFTKRAFLNGRIDLSQAEAVADIIAAKTEAALRVGLEQLEGKLSARIQEIKKDLTEVLAQMEANIDYAEDKLETLTRQEMLDRIKLNQEELGKLVETYDSGKIIREGIKVAIIGKPNVGKSSLLNCLLREEKAIVTDLPGTTRDIVEDVISIRGQMVRLMDTAGLRTSKNKIEKIGQQKTKKAMGKADLVLWVIDGNRKLSREDKVIRKQLIGKNYIAVLNKIDLPTRVQAQDIKGLGVDNVIKFSSLKATGLNILETAIIDKALKGRITGGFSENGIITSQRQFLALKQAIKRLTEVLNDAGHGAGEEFLAPTLRKSIEHLGEIIGEFVSDDIVNIIFSRFCVGK